MILRRIIKYGRIRVCGRGVDRKMAVFGCTNINYRKIFSVSALVFIGLTFGVLLNRYGFIFERITVDVTLNIKEDPLLLRNGSSRHFGNINGTKYKVPNIVHFIWFAENKKLSFLNYLSILSAHKIQKPEVIMLHCNHLPVGEWWDRLWREVPIKIMHRQPPDTVHGQKLLHMYHRGDIAKIEILTQHGGIYLDYDVIVVSPMDELRTYDVTMGKEKPPKLIAGIIVARKNAPFLKLWHQSYKDNYRPFDWDYNCARVTYQLYLKRPDLLHIEPRRLTTPDWQDRHLLWDEVINWRELFCIHVMQHLNWSEYNPDNIKKLDSTFGEVVRYIYYGSPKIIKD